MYEQSLVVNKSSRLIITAKRVFTKLVIGAKEFRGKIDFIIIYESDGIMRVAGKAPIVFGKKDAGYRISNADGPIQS